MGKFKKGHFMIRVKPKLPDWCWMSGGLVGWECGIKARVRCTSYKVKHVLCAPVAA